MLQLCVAIRDVYGCSGASLTALTMPRSALSQPRPIAQSSALYAVVVRSAHTHAEHDPVVRSCRRQRPKAREGLLRLRGDFVNCVCRSVAHMGVATVLQAISLLLFRALSYTSRRVRWA